MPGAYASLVTYGGVPGAAPSIPANAATNAAAFRAAFTAGERRILVPAGTWYFEQIEWSGNPWLPLGVEIAGEGVQDQTHLVYRPTGVAIDTVPAFQFAPGISRSLLQNFRLSGMTANLSLGDPPVPNTPPRSIAISTDRSHFNRVRDVVIFDFDVGVELNRGAGGTYSGHNVIERFEINRCRTGIRIRDATNANVIQSGRIWASVVGYDATDPGGAREEGTGIDIVGTVDPIFGPRGAHALILSGINVETAAVGLRIVSSRDVAVVGCYFEPGSAFQYPPASGTYPYGRVRRRSLEVDEHTEGLTFSASLFSEPGVPPGTENWTPTYAELVPEGRGVVDALSVPGSGTSVIPGAYAITGSGGRISGTTAAHANRIKNADFSRGAMFWDVGPQAPIVTPTTASYVTGGASVLVEAVMSSAAHMFQNFLVDSGVRLVTVNVRYALRSQGVHAFRFELRDVASNTRLGFFSDVGPGPSDWRVRSLTGRFDGLSGGVVGPRELQVRVYPYNADLNPQPASQQVYIDAVWLVDGEYAASYRPYGEAVELLAADDREVFFGGVPTSVNIGPTGAMPSNVPSNAIGMVVEIRISASEATRYGGTITVDDQSGSDPLTIVSATFDQRVTTTDVTIPLTPGVTPQWSVFVNNPANTVNYRVRVKKWILRS